MSAVEDSENDDMQSMAQTFEGDGTDSGVEFDSLNVPNEGHLVASVGPTVWLRAMFHPAMYKTSFPEAHSPNVDSLCPTDITPSFASPETMMDCVDWALESQKDEMGSDVSVGANTIEIVVARNEVSGAQLRMRSNHEFMIATDTANWLSAAGHSSRARVSVVNPLRSNPLANHVKLFIIGDVMDEEQNMVLEYLSSQNFSSAPSKTHAVYIRVYVPENVPHGFHEIPLQIFTQAAGFHDEELSWTGMLRVHVANVTLPSPRDWKFHLDLWQHLSSIARAHSVNLWSERHFQLIDQYFACLSQLGQKAVSVVATEVPWAGQQCYLEASYPSALYEHSMLDVSMSDGSLSIDFTNFDRLMRLAAKHHMDKEIEVFGLMSVWADTKHGFGGTVEGAPDFWRVRCLDKDSGKIRYLRSVEEMKEFIRLLHGHLERIDLLSRVRICADEPSNMKAFYEQMDFLRDVAPGFRIKVAINHYEFMRYAPAEVVDCVPLLPLACQNINATDELKARIREQGGRMSWYVCCSPSFPNNFVSSPLVEGQLMGWLTYFLKLDGFLRWNFCLWPAEPWSSLAWRPQWPVGDMYMVLPGKDGNPVETLRFESIRMAIQDYELLLMAEEWLSESQVQVVMEKVKKLVLRTDDMSKFADAGKRGCERTDLYSLDPHDYQSARVLLLEALSAVINRSD